MNRIGQAILRRQAATSKVSEHVIQKMTLSDGNLLLFESRTENVFKLFRTRMLLCKGKEVSKYQSLSSSLCQIIAFFWI